MAIQFENTAGGVSCFYKEANPDTLVVRVDNSCEVTLQGGKPGLRLECHPASKIKAAILGSEYGGLNASKNAILRVHGVEQGVATLRATQGDAKATLRVVVVPLSQVLVNFYCVRDGLGMKTKRTEATLVKQIAGMNEIFGGPTSIKFRKHLVLDRSFPHVDFRKRRNPAELRELFAFLGEQIPKAEKDRFVWNVFLVPDWRGTECCGKSVWGTNHRNICIIEDGITPALTSTLFAHEAGHFLGLPHKETNRRALMYPTIPDGGVEFFWNEVVTMWRFLGKRYSLNID